MKNTVKLPKAKNFLITFIPFFLLFSTIATFLIFQELRSQDLLLKSKEQKQVETLRSIANDEIKAVVSDLFLLAVHPLLHQMMAVENPAMRQNIAKHFKEFSKSTKRYDQIRFLDETGLERIRINFGQGRPYIVADDQLQNKGQRHYFADTLKLEPGHVFVSPFDLNIEHGQIEHPPKPMIRFGTPVVDPKGNKHGIVLLNFFGAKMLSKLDQSSSDAMGNSMLLNAEGYWLKGFEPEDEWGFMFKDRQDRTLAQRDPQSWQRIANRDEGQFSNDRGIYTFATIRPLDGDMLSDTGSIEKSNANSAEIRKKKVFWKIVSLVTKQTLNEQKTRFILKWLPFYGLTILLVACVSWGFALIISQRKQAVEDQIYREKLQGVIEMAGAVCHELNQPMQVILGYCDLLMIDTDDDHPGWNKIKKIESQIERLNEITQKLTKISKYETIDYLDDKIIDINKSST